MFIKRLFYFSVLLISSTLLWHCKPEPPEAVIEEVIEEPPIVENPVVNHLNEAVAGLYVGQYRCGGYDGTMYYSYVDTGTIEIVALGTDSLRVSHSNGCVFDTYVYQYDPLDMNTYGYTRWPGDGPSVGIYHFAANDSILVTTPQHFSIGWLGRAFYGKKQ